MRGKRVINAGELYKQGQVVLWIGGGVPPYAGPPVQPCGSRNLNCRPNIGPGIHHHMQVACRQQCKWRREQSWLS